MGTKIGLNQVKSDTPSWVLGVVAALTFALQGIPPLIIASTAVEADTKELMELYCGVANILVAAFALFFGVKKQ